LIKIPNNFIFQTNVTPFVPYSDVSSLHATINAHNPVTIELHKNPSECNFHSLEELNNRLDQIHSNPLDIKVLIKNFNYLSNQAKPREKFTCLNKIYNKLLQLINTSPHFDYESGILVFDFLKQTQFDSKDMVGFIGAISKRIEEVVPSTRDLSGLIKALGFLNPSFTESIITLLGRKLNKVHRMPIFDLINIFEGIKYNQTSPTQEILKKALQLLQVQSPKNQAKILRYLKHHNSDLYFPYLTQVLNPQTITEGHDDLEFNLNILNLPSHKKTNSLLESALKHLNRLSKQIDFTPLEILNLILNCKNKIHSQIEKIINIVLEQIKKSNQQKFTFETLQSMTRVLTLINYETQGAIAKIQKGGTYSSIKNKLNNLTKQKISSRGVNFIEKKACELLKRYYPGVRFEQQKYFNGIEQDIVFNLPMPKGKAQTINVEIDGQYHLHYGVFLSNTLRDKYLESKEIKVIRIKLPGGNENTVKDLPRLFRLAFEKEGITLPSLSP
jgi:hypothetical protein